MQDGLGPEDVRPPLLERAVGGEVPDQRHDDHRENDDDHAEAGADGPPARVSASDSAFAAGTKNSGSPG